MGVLITLRTVHSGVPTILYLTFVLACAAVVCDGHVFFAVFFTFRHPEQSFESHCDWLHMTPAFDKMETQNYLWTCPWPQHLNMSMYCFDMALTLGHITYQKSGPDPSLCGSFSPGGWVRFPSVAFLLFMHFFLLFPLF
jgi:hypothetical protein